MDISYSFSYGFLSVDRFAFESLYCCFHAFKVFLLLQMTFLLSSFLSCRFSWHCHVPEKNNHVINLYISQWVRGLDANSDPGLLCMCMHENGNGFFRTLFVAQNTICLSVDFICNAKRESTGDQRNSFKHKHPNNLTTRIEKAHENTEKKRRREKKAVHANEETKQSPQSQRKKSTEGTGTKSETEMIIYCIQWQH